MNKKNIIWLASYPKSGNTWCRVFLTNLLYPSATPANINDLAEASISSSRKLFDDYTGISSADLSFEEIDKLRPDVYRMQSQESDELIFKKVHDKYSFVKEGQALFPPEISKGAIYLIRNPLDVLVSFAYHSAKPINNMVKAINNSSYALCDKSNRLSNQLRQIMGSWSDHVKSWTEQTEIPTHIMRYEDMVLNTFKTFSKVVGFIDIEKTENEIRGAIEKSDFKILSGQEKENGFKEKMIKSTSFFRKGKIGDWKNHLMDDMINEIIKNHRDMMIKFGYLNKSNEIMF